MIKKIKKWYMANKAVRNYMFLARMINNVDNAFKLKGVSKQQRKQFWHDFVNSEGARRKFIQDMKTELLK